MKKVEKPYQHIVPNKLLKGFTDEKFKNKINIISLSIPEKEEGFNRNNICGEDYFYSKDENDPFLDDKITECEAFHHNLNKFLKEKKSFKHYKIVENYSKTEQPIDCIRTSELNAMFKYIILSAIRTKGFRDFIKSTPMLLIDFFYNNDAIEKQIEDAIKPIKNFIKQINDPILKNIKNEELKTKKFELRQNLVKDINDMCSLFNLTNISKNIHNQTLLELLNRIEKNFVFPTLTNKKLYLVKTGEDLILPDTIVLCLNNKNEAVIFPDKTVETIILPISYNKYIMLTEREQNEDNLFEVEELNTLLSKNSFDFFVHRYDKDFSKYKKNINTKTGLTQLSNNKIFKEN